MPGVGIVINIGGYKVNSAIGSAMVNVGDNLLTTPQSESKNKTAGPFSAGDCTLNNAPTGPIFNDPDVVDTSTLRPVSTS